MKLLLAILFLAALVGVIALAKRRGSTDSGYRRRFENRYRHDPSGDSGADAPLFVPGLFMPGARDSGSHHHHAHGHPTDCGSHVAHSDGGAAGCGDGGSN